MLHIGCHLSSSKGFAAMGRRPAVSRQIPLLFLLAIRAAARPRPLIPRMRIFSKRAWAPYGTVPLVAHAPYTLNPCSTKEEVRQFALETIADDLHKLEALPGNYYNMHPGNHLGQGAEIGIELIAACLNRVLYEKQQTTLLLETMAGKGTEVGRSFEEIRAILERIALQDKVGVCLDTCHIWDAGYDIVSDLDGVIREFDRVIGLSRLKAIHLNDSKNPLGAHKDRHEKIGEGMIGQVALSRVVRHPSLAGLPFILETPNELSGYAHEIDMMRQEAAK